MFLTLLYTLLGPIGRAIMDFYYQNQVIILIIFVVWGVIMTYASMGMRRLRTEAITVTLQHLKKQPGKSDQEIFEAVISRLTSLTTQKAVMVPNRYNFWIQKATPAYLTKLLKLGPEWVHDLRSGEVKRDILTLPGPNYKLKQ